MKSLIVEDEMLGRTLLLEVLRPFGTVHAAANGKEAVEAGCDGRMLKPYDPDRIVQQLRDFGLIV